MLFFNVNNYADFREKFGMRETNEGAKVRTEKVTLQILKDMFRNRRNDPMRWDDFFVVKRVAQPIRQSDYANMFCLPANGDEPANEWTNLLMDGHASLPSADYEILNGGICFDGDTNAIRYRKEGKVYKMKASKLFAKIFAENKLDMFYGERMKVYLAERFAERWSAYASTKCGDEYELHVDDNFRGIYAVEGMGSCMTNRGSWRFYRDAVKAKAAYLTNADGDIVCRCVIYTECRQYGTDKVLRYAERQYAVGGDDRLKAILIGKLYAAGEIDIHKRVGASCHASDDIQDATYQTIDETRLEIDCHLHDGDSLSYQDSFKSYDLYSETAYNYACGDYDLADTDGTFHSEEHEGQVFSDYEDEWIDEDEATWVESRQDYFYTDDTRWCENTETDEYYEDCVVLANGDYAYYGRGCRGYDGVCYCEQCEEYYLEGDEVYSELTGDYYCSEYCRDEAEKDYKADHWHYCDEDGEYYESDEDMLTVNRWVWGRYDKYTIMKEDFNEYVEEFEATEYNGEYFIDQVGHDGEPVHIAAYAA